MLSSYYFTVYKIHLKKIWIVFLYMLAILFPDLNWIGASGASSFSFLTSTRSLITTAGNYKVKTWDGFQWHEIPYQLTLKFDLLLYSLKHAAHSYTQTLRNSLFFAERVNCNTIIAEDNKV